MIETKYVVYPIKKREGKITLSSIEIWENETPVTPPKTLKETTPLFLGV